MKKIKYLFPFTTLLLLSYVARDMIIKSKLNRDKKIINYMYETQQKQYGKFEGEKGIIYVLTNNENFITYVDNTPNKTTAQDSLNFYSICIFQNDKFQHISRDTTIGQVTLSLYNKYKTGHTPIPLSNFHFKKGTTELDIKSYSEFTNLNLYNNLDSFNINIIADTFTKDATDHTHKLAIDRLKFIQNQIARFYPKASQFELRALNNSSFMAKKVLEIDSKQ